jgi:lambda family phage portal protein
MAWSLKNLVSGVAPTLFRVREFARETGRLQVLQRALEAASPRRPWGGGPVGEGIGNATLAAGLLTVRARSRHASVNNSWLANGVAAWVVALVGSGIVPAATIAEAGPRATITDAWNRWTDRADADGITDLYGIQATAARGLVVDGEAFIHLLTGPDGGLRVRLLAADQIDFSLTRELSDGGRIINGIEFSADGRRVAYHVLQNIGPLNLSVAPPIRVPADDICHVFKPLFAGQVRGIPWAAPILLTLNEIDQLGDALLVAAKTAAMFAGFIKDMNSVGSIPFDGTQQGSILTGGLEPGTLKILPSGFDISFAQPQS